LTLAPALTARILTNPSEMRALSPDWQRLWDRCPNATTFQRPHWLLSWIEAFRPSDPYMIEFRLGDDLVGIIPLLIYSCGTERVLGLMGGGVSDYLDALIHPEHESEILSLLPSVLRQQISGWDTLHFTDLPSTSALLKDNAIRGMEVLPHEVCPVLELPSRMEELRTVVPFHKMANVRNARNRMAQAGASQLQVASSETALPTLDALFQMHTSRWQRSGQPGVLAEDNIRQFHRLLAPTLVEEGVLRLYSLSLERETIAMLYTLFEKESVLFYLQAFDPSQAHLSPGTCIVGSVIEDAIRAGKRQANFLRGNEPYKYQWGARDTSTFAVQASAAVLDAVPGRVAA
jgi:CelD/BcsL family acetyltransferase involved in cellulose biosynthesis